MTVSKSMAPGHDGTQFLVSFPLSNNTFPAPWLFHVTKIELAKGYH